MATDNIQKIVYEFPKEKFDNMMAAIEKIPPPVTELTPVADNNGRIPASDFAYIVGIGKTTLNHLIAGTHPSGFKLRCFKKEGTKTVWTLQSEVERYFEGFGSPS